MASSSGNNGHDLLTDSSVAPRIKAVIVALEAWASIHMVVLRAHELLSIANLNRINHIPESLYQVFEKLKTFDRKFSELLLRVLQSPDVRLAIFFAKTFNERHFDGGEMQAEIASNLARASHLTKTFKKQVQEAENILSTVEQEIYERVPETTIGLSKVQKIHLQQPHALHYVPATIELYYEPGIDNSGAGAYSGPLLFLRNRRRQMEMTLEQFVTTHYGSALSTLDARDFRHEAEILESEINLVSDLHRLLSMVRLIEQGHDLPVSNPGDHSTGNSVLHANSLANLYQESISLLQNMQHAYSGNSERHDGLRNGLDSNFSNTRQSFDIRNSFYNDYINPVNTRPPTTVLNSTSFTERARHGCDSRLSEPVFDPTLENIREGGRRVIPRSRWFSQGFDPLLSLNLDDTDRSRRWNNRTSELNNAFVTGSTSNLMGNSLRNDLLSSSRSAFQRIHPQANIASNTQNSRTRSSSITDFLDYTSNVAEPSHDLNFEVNDYNFHEMPASETNSQLLRDLITKVEDVLQTVSRSESILMEQRNDLRSLNMSVQELRQSMGRVRDDITVLKCQTSAFPRSFLYESNIPTRNTSDELWRNLDSGESRRTSTTNERMQMNISTLSSTELGGSRSDIRTPSQNNELRSSRSRPQLVTHSYPHPSASTPLQNGDMFDMQNNTTNNSMLNNQVAPGNRANNYWDNFKSYSRLNLLSEAKPNTSSGVSPSGGATGADEHLHFDTDDYLIRSRASPSMRRDSRGDRPAASSAIRSSLSANFVENIGQKKRNKDQKKQFQLQQSSNSPILNSSSSNSSARGSFNDLIASSSRNSTNANAVNEQIAPNGSSEVNNEISAVTESGFAAATSALDRSIEEAVAQCAAVQLTSISPVSPLFEVGLVSREEFLQRNSGAGSSASGNGRSDDGGPSSSSSKKELEKLLSDDSSFPPPQTFEEAGWAFSNLHDDVPAARPEWLWERGRREDVPRPENDKDESTPKKDDTHSTEENKD